MLLFTLIGVFTVFAAGVAAYMFFPNTINKVVSTVKGWFTK